jgi:hypothetical protein
MGQMQRISSNNTAVFTDNEGTKVVLHSTCVVRFNSREIELDSGGWETVTTKARMNQASNQFNLGYQVFQKDWQWYVDYKGETLEYHDGIILNR